MKLFKFDLPQMPGVRTLPCYANMNYMCIKVQNNNPVLYAMCSGEKVDRVLGSFHTGEDVFSEDFTAYIGTALLDGGKYVLHYFI